MNNKEILELATKTIANNSASSEDLLSALKLCTMAISWQQEHPAQDPVSLKVKAVMNYGNNSQLLFIDEINGLHVAIDIDSFALADIAEKQLNNFFSKVQTSKQKELVK